MTIWVAGPATEISARRALLIGRVGLERGVAGHEVERDRGVGAGRAGGDGVAELVQQREARPATPASHSPNASR